MPPSQSSKPRIVHVKVVTYITDILLGRSAFCHMILVHQRFEPIGHTRCRIWQCVHMPGSSLQLSHEVQDRQLSWYDADHSAQAHKEHCAPVDEKSGQKGFFLTRIHALVCMLYTWTAKQEDYICTDYIFLY